MLNFRKGLVLAPAHLSPEKVVLARVKDRNFAQLVCSIVVGFTCAEDLKGQPDADQTADEQTQDEIQFARKKPVVCSVGHSYEHHPIRRNWQGFSAARNVWRTTFGLRKLSRTRTNCAKDAPRGSSIAFQAVIFALKAALGASCLFEFAPSFPDKTFSPARRPSRSRTTPPRPIPPA